MTKHCSLIALEIIGLMLTTSPILAQSVYEPYTFSTLAGNAGYGSVDATGSVARFNSPVGVAVDSAGNVYVADTPNNTIRKVTPDGVVTTLAGLAGSYGSVDGTGTTARFNQPQGVAVDSAGNVYVADSNNSTIRKVTPTGVVTTLAGLAGSYGSVDATGSVARFYGPWSVAVDNAGNVYVADLNNYTIRKVSPAGAVTTLAGLAGEYLPRGADGLGSAARFFRPQGVSVDHAGSVYVADYGNSTIRKLTPVGTNWMVTTLAGLAGSYGSVDGTGSGARFESPQGITVDGAGDLYVSDQHNYTIRKVTAAGVVTTLAGLADSYGSADGTGSAARFGDVSMGPSSVTVDRAGNVYVADTPNNTIRKVTPAGVVTTLAGLSGYPRSAEGMGSAARFYHPSAAVVDSAGNVYVADEYNYTIRKVTPAGMVTTLAGLAGSYGAAGGTGSAARFAFPCGIAMDGAGNLYVSHAHEIRKVTAEGVVTTMAGGNVGNADGTGSAARFAEPTGVAVDGAGNVYVADSSNYKIRKLTPVGTNWMVTTLAVGFNYPLGVAVDSAGFVYVSDTRNYTIRKVTPAGVVTTLAGREGNPGNADGTGSAARFSYPTGIAVDRAGNVYVADTASSTIRKVTTLGVVTTLAGETGNTGSVDGKGNAARFYKPYGVAVDDAGNVYVADSYNNRIQKGYAESAVVVISGPSFGFAGGKFGFFLTGPTGRSVIVEASGNLFNWFPVWTNTFSGDLNFIDPRSGVSSNGYFRARLP